MRDVSSKVNTLRIATARATLKASPETIELIKKGGAPKGDPLPVAKVAAIQAAKNCSQIIPYCHPLPVDWVGVEFDLDEDAIHITTTVKAIYKTGVEMEALTAASVAALTIYDMLKMVDELMQIETVVLLDKKGGKSDFKNKREGTLKAAVLVLSDTCAAGKKQDVSGRLIVEKLEEEGLSVEEYKIIPDDAEQAKANLLKWSDDLGLDIIITTGGTGLSSRDTTPEAIKGLIERELPGVAETLRAYGQERNPFAMFSRSLAGVRSKTVIITLPGSTGGVKDGLSALFPFIFHAFKMLNDECHDTKNDSRSDQSMLPESSKTSIK
jgi:molybdenum cofactor biosynthesis protein MoaC